MNTHDLLQIAIPLGLVGGLLLWKRLGQVSREEAHALVAQGALLVDVRSSPEFASGHLDGAKNFPVQVLGEQADKLGAKDKPIVVYCASGTRSAMARSMLKGRGFTRVYNLGAMGRW
jgi:rhodanese-related sulfurtransferase